MIPRLIGIEKIEDHNVWFTDQNTCGVSIYLNAIDLELNDIERFEHRNAGFLRNQDQEILVRIKTDVFDDSSGFGDFARREDLKRLTQTEKIISIHFEMHTGSVLEDLKNIFKDQTSTRFEKATQLIAKLRMDFLSEVDPLPWTKSDIESYFKKVSKSSIIYNDVGLSIGTKYLGILKLTDLAKYGLSTESLGLILQSLSSPFEVSLTISKINQLKMSYFLNQKSAQEKTGSGLVSDEKYRESEESMRDLELGGNQYYFIEMHFITESRDLKNLMSRIDEAQNALTAIGEFNHETVGSFQSYCSTIVGARTHFGKQERLIEKDSNICCYMPLLFQGSHTSLRHKELGHLKVHKNSLAYHRNDGSIDFLNIYDEQNSSYSSFIVGQPGKGKSVLVNQFVRSLLYNAKASIVVLDVKGSYKRQCEFLNGELFEVDWNKSAFINPLSFLKNEMVLNNANSIEIVYQFIQTLVLDKNETELSGKEEIFLKKLIKSYIEKRPQNPSIDDFQKYAGDFRTEHLSRWVSGGIYEHVFSNSGNENTGNSIAATYANNFKYFNIQDINQASNTTLSGVIMSAIMMEVLMHFLIKNVDDQFVFVIDEAPFFIKHNFESIKFLTKNVRKMNGALLLVAQASTDLTPNGREDLISDIPNKIIFTMDGSREDYKEKMRFDDRDIGMIEQLQTENRKYSKFFLKDYFGSRIGSIVLTPEEYWRSTTLPSDVALIEKIKHIFPDAPYEKIQNVIIGMEY
jgi:hypothetical protein